MTSVWLKPTAGKTDHAFDFVMCEYANADELLGSTPPQLSLIVRRARLPGPIPRSLAAGRKGRSTSELGAVSRDVSGRSDSAAMTSLDPAEFKRRAEERALRRLAKIDGKSHVGKRHHIVPRSHLARFADASEQLIVRDRTSGALSTRAIRDLSVRDFYTTIIDSGELDSSMETLLGDIEASAAEVIARHLDAPAFKRAKRLPPEERGELDMYVAFQMIRGMRPRRQQELLVDYYAKLTGKHGVTDLQLDEFEIAPHQNEHIKSFAHHAPRIHAELMQRAARVTTLDAPLLLIGDEPVVLTVPDGWVRPLGADSDGFSRVKADGVRREDIVQISGGRDIGLADAHEVVLPLSPTKALVYGPRRDSRYLDPITVRGNEAISVAGDINRLVIDGAVDWVAAHPGHPSFRSMDWPPVRPLATVIDGGSVAAQVVNEHHRRKPRRIDKNARPKAE